MKKEKNKLYVALLILIFIFSIVSVLAAFYQKQEAEKEVIMTIDGIDVYDTEYNFFYTSLVNTYYLANKNNAEYLNLDITKDLKAQECLFDEYDTWAVFFKSITDKTIIETHKLYEDLLKNEYKYDTSKDWDNFFDQLKEKANENKLSISRMIKKMYGKHATELEIRKTFEIYTMANKYRSYLRENANISENDIKMEYEKNKNHYDKASYLEYTIYADINNGDSEETINEKMADAKIKAKEFFDAVYDEDTFKEQAQKYSGENSPNIRYENVFYKDVDSSIAEWIFSCEEEKQITYIEDKQEHCYRIVYFISRIKDVSKTATIRQILFTPVTSVENYLPTEEDYAKSLIEANSVLEEFNKGDKSENSFSELAKKYSDDNGSSEYGGLINLIEPGQYEADMNKWIFDSRKSGDVGIVKTTYGYHILYFVEYTEPIWQLTIEAELKEKYVGDYIENLTKECIIEYPNN